ncbi:hypothetical protein [Streptomyces sp. HUCO-GS316]|uniref:hypothetical protein n=1 Tax=Streptomyces sp. HUCO-GS316 TaxID=2692198 RepID=UPI001F16A87E|nr:hypothetical protein [Streptomyces sp. HUCO-GS316]
MTDTSTRAQTHTGVAAARSGPRDITGPGPRLFGPRARGRHRRPRRHKVLLTAGGLAVAAGVLSLVRMAPDSEVGGTGTAEAEPRTGPGPGADRPDDAAATDGTAPRAMPSATYAMGGLSLWPTPTSSLLAAPPTAALPAPATTGLPDSTTIPDTPNTPAPHPSATTDPAPQPTRTPAPVPSRSTPPPEPEPEPDQPGLCLPIISLCVDAPLEDSLDREDRHSATRPRSSE